MPSPLHSVENIREGAIQKELKEQQDRLIIIHQGMTRKYVSYIERAEAVKKEIAEFEGKLAKITNIKEGNELIKEFANTGYYRE